MPQNIFIHLKVFTECLDAGDTASGKHTDTLALMELRSRTETNGMLLVMNVTEKVNCKSRKGTSGIGDGFGCFIFIFIIYLFLKDLICLFETERAREHKLGGAVKRE